MNFLEKFPDWDLTGLLPYITQMSFGNSSYFIKSKCHWLKFFIYTPILHSVKSKTLPKWIRIQELHSNQLKIIYRIFLFFRITAFPKFTVFFHVLFLIAPSATFSPRHLSHHFSPLHPHPLATRYLGNSQLPGFWVSSSIFFRQLPRYFS